MFYDLNVQSTETNACIQGNTLTRMSSAAGQKRAGIIAQGETNDVIYNVDKRSCPQLQQTRP